MGISYDPNTSTYTVNAAGRVTTTKVTASGEIVAEWIHSVYPYLRHTRAFHDLQPIVGMDVKSNAGGDNGQNPIAVLTLYTGGLCIVFQICRCNSIPTSLHDFLADDQLLFVTAESHRAPENLFANYGLLFENVEDLAETATVQRLLEEKSINFEELAQTILQMELEKPEVGDSNWEDDPLTLEQIECATIDAFVRYKLGKQYY